jgi:cytochrome P450
MDIPTTAAPRFPFPRELPFDPPPQYAGARPNEPILPVTLWNGQRAWLLLRHDDLRAVMVDPRFSGEFARPDFPAVTEARVAIDKRERAFVGMDNPRHDHYRRMFTKEFTFRRMAALRPSIEAIVDRLLTEMQRHGPPLDLVGAFCVKLPALVMCALFGSPYEDHGLIMRCAAGRHGLTQSPDEAARSADELVGYVRQLIAVKERQPGDDLLTRVIRDHVEGGALSREDLAEIGSMILRAGHDTTANMISLGTLLLLQHPDQLAALLSDPALVDGAVEELLRFLSPVQFAPRRVSLEDVPIRNVVIRKGDGVFGLAPAANRDPDAFPDPDRFDIRREATHHVTFGYGIHQCLGQGLARIELQAVYPALFKRFPTLHVTQPIEAIPFKRDMQIYGIHRLPVGW